MVLVLLPLSWVALRYAQSLESYAPLVKAVQSQAIDFGVENHNATWVPEVSSERKSSQGRARVEREAERTFHFATQAKTINFAVVDDTAVYTSVTADSVQYPPTSFPKNGIDKLELALEVAGQLPSEHIKLDQLRDISMPHGGEPPNKGGITGSFWILARASGQQVSLVDGGVLGGSQAGVRLHLPLASLSPKLGVGASLRMASPLNSVGRELSLGVSLKRSGTAPVEAVVERRMSLDGTREKRWAMLIAGGFNGINIAQDFKLDGYGQAGLVGLKSPLPFAGGAISLHKRAMKIDKAILSAGVSVWGDVQPGISRMDVGPEMSMQTHLGDVPVKVSAQWRVRIAGNAKPGSGPALTIAGDF